MGPRGDVSDIEHCDSCSRAVADALLRIVCMVFVLGFLSTVPVASPAAQTGTSDSAPPPADAPAPAPGFTPELDAAFDAMMRDPANLDLTFRYAALAAQAGQLEGAIAALERMLLINPDLPRVRLELGVLYYRLGSFDVAKSYLTQAGAHPSAPPEVRERVGGYLAEIDRLTSRHRLRGSAVAGVRWQSNANAGPASDLVKAQGFDASLDSRFQRQRDWNAFAAASAEYVYDLQNANRDAIEAALNLYGTRQFKLTALDLSVSELTLGPRFGTDSLLGTDSSIRPYIIGNIVTLDQSRYYATGGAGLSYRQPIGERLALDLAGEWRRKDYKANASSPSLNDQDSDEYDLVAVLRGALTPNQILTAGVIAVHEQASARFKSRNELSASLGYSLSYEPLLDINPRPWTFNASVARTLTRYGAPDPSVDPVTTRSDHEWRFSILNAISVTDRASLMVQALRTNLSSNLPNFENSNTAITFGAIYEF